MIDMRQKVEEEDAKNMARMRLYVEAEIRRQLNLGPDDPIPPTQVHSVSFAELQPGQPACTVTITPTKETTPEGG